MQTLDIITVNLWQILISLCNLLLSFFILKRFLFKPVKKILQKRQSVINEHLDAAMRDRDLAAAQKDEWDKKIRAIEKDAQTILNDAAVAAKQRGDTIITAAQAKADDLVRQAVTQISLDRKKAETEIQTQIVTVSSALAEKLLQRELKADDHHQLIAAFMQELGEYNG